MTYVKSWFEMYLNDHGGTIGQNKITITDESLMPTLKLNRVWASEHGSTYTIIRISHDSVTYQDIIGNTKIMSPLSGFTCKIRMEVLRVLPENQLSKSKLIKIFLSNVYQEVVRLYKGIIQ